MIKEIKGDLLELASKGHFDYIIHGCNCFNVMGAGIALQIALKYPKAWAKDQRTIAGSINKLGSFTLSYVPIVNNGMYIVNLYTQFKPGRNFDIKALDFGLYKLKEIIPPDSKIGLPYIGAGIGGGDWKEIKKVIKKHLSNFNVTIVKYER